MGNKLARRRAGLEERHLKPSGLYPHIEVDVRKLRRLILDRKISPCYPGSEECTEKQSEECPICFLYYPCLNRSRCCQKAICTECYLQVRVPASSSSSRAPPCPFCKVGHYSVVFHGAKSTEEKMREEAEEQAVIAAKIRIRQEEMRAQAENEARRQQQMRQQQEDRAAAAASGAATSSASTTHGTAAPSSTSTSNSNATTPPELLAPARSLRLSEDAYAGSRDLAPGSGDVHAGPMGGSGHGSHALPGSALAWGQHFTQSSSGGHTRYLGTQLDGSGRGGMRRNSGSHNSLVEFGANAALVAHSHSSSGSGGGGGQERATQGGRSSGGGNTQVWSQEDEFWRRQGGAHEEGGAHGAVPLGAGPPGDWPLYTTASGGGAGANAGVGAPSSANVPPMAAGGGMQQGSSGGMQRSHHGDMGGGMTRGREGADASGGGNRGHRHQGSSGGGMDAQARQRGHRARDPGVSSLNDFLATRLWNDVPLSDYFPQSLLEGAESWASDLQVDVEDVMLMEAIWLSLQDQDKNAHRRNMPQSPSPFSPGLLSPRVHSPRPPPLRPPLTEAPGSVPPEPVLATASQVHASSTTNDTKTPAPTPPGDHSAEEASTAERSVGGRSAGGRSAEDDRSEEVELFEQHGAHWLSPVTSATNASDATAAASDATRNVETSPSPSLPMPMTHIQSAPGGDAVADDARQGLHAGASGGDQIRPEEAGAVSQSESDGEEPEWFSEMMRGLEGSRTTQVMVEGLRASVNAAEGAVKNVAIAEGAAESTDVVSNGGGAGGMESAQGTRQAAQGQGPADQNAATMQQISGGAAD